MYDLSSQVRYHRRNGHVAALALQLIVKQQGRHLYRCQPSFRCHCNKVIVLDFVRKKLEQ